MNTQARIDALLAEATVDCYNEEEEFGGVLVALEDNLVFPLQAKAVGETVTVVGLNSERSSLRRGIVARVCKGDQEYNMSLAELEFASPDPTSAEWLEVYRYWAGE